jgi:hypothetical protein
VHQLKTAEERKEPYEEAKCDKEKIEIAADGETKKVYLDDMPTSISKKKKSLYNSRTKKDVFTWSAKDLQGVDRDIIEHALETDERIPPKKQNFGKCLKKK